MAAFPGSRAAALVGVHRLETVAVFPSLFGGKKRQHHGKHPLAKKEQLSRKHPLAKNGNPTVASRSPGNHRLFIGSQPI